MFGLQIHLITYHKLFSHFAFSFPPLPFSHSLSPTPSLPTPLLLQGWRTARYYAQMTEVGERAMRQLHRCLDGAQ